MRSKQKKYVGYVLMASPAIYVFIDSVVRDGWVKTLTGFGVLFAILMVLWTGMVLVDRAKREEKQ